MKTLALQEERDVNYVAWPTSFAPVRLDSTALKVFTDFTERKPEVIHSRMKAVAAEALMRGEHVRLKLVVDDFDRLSGVVTLDELNGEEILKKLRRDFTATIFL